MDQLPTELLLESLSLLTVPTIIVVGNINNLTRKLTKEKWLIHQFPHCQIDNQPIFRDKLVNLDINVDITNQLLKISQDSYQSDEQLLWCLLHYAVRDVAWYAARNAVWDAIQDAVWDADWDIAREAVWSVVPDAVWVAVRNAAWVTAWYAARNAVWDPVQDATRNATRNAVWDEPIRDAVRTAINSHKITDPKLIGQFAYITAEKTILIKLPEIVKMCRSILIEKIPNYREIVVDLKIPTDTTNPFFLQYRKLFVTK